jgi:hypothetical protein
MPTPSRMRWKRLVGPGGANARNWALSFACQGQSSTKRPRRRMFLFGSGSASLVAQERDGVVQGAAQHLRYCYATVSKIAEPLIHASANPRCTAGVNANDPPRLGLADPHRARRRPSGQ